jgi:hypothetical protein
MISRSPARAVLALFAVLAQLGTTTAPADRYFGRLEMSALRIRYETLQLRKRYETHELLPDQCEHLLLLTEDAFHQWAALYPKDPWLPSTAFNMAQLYEELPGRLARDHAVALLVFIKSSFPETSYARRSRDRLHRGVWTKASPQWAVNATAAPSPAPAPPTPSPAPSPQAR